jgi:hypothetical protein
MDKVQRIERSNTAPSSKTFRDELRSLVFYNELKSSWEKKLYKAVCTQEARRGIGW